MKTVKDNKFLNEVINEFKIEIPSKFLDLSIYNEIENFKDAEYVYCIAYEMLIRTDEYNTLLKEYEPLKNKSKQNMTDAEFLKLRELIKKMNDLGLKKTSFFGFDCGDDNDHVFKKIEYYEEIINSSWNVRLLHKVEIEPSLGYNSIFHMLIDFYNKKKQLYVLEDGEYKNIFLEKQETNESNEINFINNIHITDIHKFIDIFFISDVITDKKTYKALKDITYLNELDKDFLALLKEKQNNDLLIPAKSDFTNYNMEFWNKFYVNDIKDGLNKLIEFHINSNKIYNKNIQYTNASIDEILKNPSKFYIPCVNRLTPPIVYKWDITSDIILDNNFIKSLEFDGIKSILGKRGYITLKKEENIHLVQLSEYISLSLLDDSFLKTLTYEDLKNIYINTEPKFSRPRLMFDEARLTNIPINLNLSKEDLLLYISQIKDEYDRDKNIVKTDKEYFLNLLLESDFAQMPANIKFANIKRIPNDKKLLPVIREDFKKRLFYAFYIYDLYKFFLPYMKQKINAIRTKRDTDIQKEKDEKGFDTIDHDKIERIKEKAKGDISNYTNGSLITEISYLLKGHLSEETIKYCLTTMKEFIHGINLKGEQDNLKKVNNPEKEENPKPKYKNLIIGNSFITKNAEFCKKLGF